MSRFAVEVARRANDDLVRRFCDALEQLAASEDEAVVNLIHVAAD